jgi:EYS protein
VSIPTFAVVKNHSSYLQYLSPRGAVNLLDLRMEIHFANHSKSRRNGLLFYIGLHDHLSVGSDGDYLALGVLNNRVVLQFNLGSGAVSVTSEPLNPDQEWFAILAGRRGRDGYMYVDDQVKEARSPPPLVGLNVFGRLYLGGVPQFSMLNNEVGND